MTIAAVTVKSSWSARIGRGLEAAHHPGVAAAPDEQPDGLAGLADRRGGEAERLVDASSVPTSRYGPASSWFRPADQPRTLAPCRSEPVAASPAAGRGRGSGAGAGSRAVRSSFGLMMLSIICMLAPTHWTKFVWATKSPLRRRGRGGTARRRRQPTGAARDGRDRSEGGRSADEQRRGRARTKIPGGVASSTNSSAGRQVTVPATSRPAPRPAASSRRQTRRSRPARQAAGPGRAASAASSSRGRRARTRQTSRPWRDQRSASAAALGRSRAGSSRRSRVLDRDRIADAVPPGARSAAIPRRRGVVERERAAQQRAPRERDRQLVCDARQLGGQALGGRDDEQRVRQAALRRGSCGTERRLGHRRGGRVDADDERAGLAPGARRGPPDRRRSEVDDDPVGAGDPMIELADVHLGDAPADHACAWPGIYTAPRAASPPSRAPIGPYERRPVAVRPWDPRVARRRRAGDRDHPRPPGRTSTSSTSAARRCRACRARGSSTSARRPTRPTIPAITDGDVRAGLRAAARARTRGRRRGRCTSGRHRTTATSSGSTSTSSRAAGDCAKDLRFRDALRADPALARRLCPDQDGIVERRGGTARRRPSTRPRRAAGSSTTFDRLGIPRPATSSGGPTGERRRP